MPPELVTDPGRARHASWPVTKWVLCRGCGELIYGKRMARSAHVCPACGHHQRITALDRVDQLLDRGDREPLEVTVAERDPLEFTDSLPYPKRLAAAREATGLEDAAIAVRGRIEGHQVIVAVMDFRFMGGSLGGAVGELITVAAEHALAERIPLLIVSASGGARMQEGAIALMQMAKTAQALGRLDAAGVLTLCLVTDPTYGGVAASFATLCDVIIAEPGARLGFAGPRVIQQTIGQPLPEGFQTAEFLREHGMIDVIAPRSAQRAVLARLLGAGMAGDRRTSRPAAEAEPRVDVVSPIDAAPSMGVAASAAHPRAGQAVIREAAALSPCEPWLIVRQARAIERPTTLDYVEHMITDFQELHGDRIGHDCPAIVGGVGRLDDRPVMVIGHQKGTTAAELKKRNFGMPLPSGYRKAARLMRLAAKLDLPVITLIDTPGAYPGLEAESGGQAVAIAENLRLMSRLPVPVVAVVVGEGGSGGALALAVADRVLICANATYSVISPEGCAAILWKDAAAAPRAAAQLGLDARRLLELGVVDGVVPEPPGGAGRDPQEAAWALRRAIREALAEVDSLTPDSRIALRHARFRRFGTERYDGHDRHIRHEVAGVADER